MTPHLETPADSAPGVGIKASPSAASPARDLRVEGGTRVALLVPDGVGVRNFVLGPFFQRARAAGSVLTLHSIPEDVRLRLGVADADTEDAAWEPLLEWRDSAATLILRKALLYAHMYWADTFAMRYKLSKPAKGSRRDRAVAWSARVAGRAVAAAGGIRQLDRLHWLAASQRPSVRRYRELFARWRPSVLLSTNQRALGVIPAVIAARSLGIPTAAFIFSWDNLTAKGRIAAPFDHFLVWSEHMKAELLRFHPEVGSERVHIVGTPQFEPYSDESLIIPRREFFRGLGADPDSASDRPLICYSGGDAGTCPEDPLHVSLLMDLIRSGKIARSPQVVLRPMPVDRQGRFDEVRRRFPELLFAKPSWIRSGSSQWEQVIPTAEDIRSLANLVHHADLNVNVASTMTLDFAIHDKPVVNIAFDVASPAPFGVPLDQYYYRFDHYRPVVEFGASRIARSPAELADQVNAYLDDPSLDREGRRRLVELQVGVPIHQSSARIVEVLDALSRASA